MSWKLLGSTLIFIAMLGCDSGAGSGSATTTVDSAGVAIVTSSSVDHPLPWSFELDRFIGGEDSGPASFTGAAPATVRTNGTDRIAVLDRDAFRVQVFDESGEHLHTMGAEGAGPGEFSFAFELFDAGRNRVGLTDFAKRARIIWSLDGELVEEVRDTGGGLGDDQLMLRGDSIVIAVEEQDSLRSLSRLVLVFENDTTELERLEAAGRRFVELSCVALAIPPMFSPRLVWANNEESVAGVVTSRYGVNIYRGGRLVRSIRRAIAATPTTENDALKQYPEGWTMAFQGGQQCTMEGTEVAEKVGMASHLPVITRVAFGPGGTVWTLRHAFPDEPPVVDVFEGDGAYLGTVNGRGLPLGWLGDNRILFADHDDETGVRRIGIYRINR